MLETRPKAMRSCYWPHVKDEGLKFENINALVKVT